VQKRFFPAVIRCPSLHGGITRGSVHLSNANNIGSVATYSCGRGYYLDIQDTRQCESNGVWSGSQPTCQGGANILTMSKILI